MITRINGVANLTGPYGDQKQKMRRTSPRESRIFGVHTCFIGLLPKIHDQLKIYIDFAKNK